MTYNCVRLMAYNYADSDLLANSTITSVQSSFPLANMFNKQRRSKVTRTAGFFEITSSNNVIYFKESALGSNLSATLTVGNYTSIASFLTELKNALDTAGANTYTVTQSNFRFQFVTSGSYLSFLTSNASFTAYDILGFDNTVDKTNTTILADELRIHDYERITFDMGVATDPSMFALIGLRNESIKISPTATIKLQGNHTNNWTSPVYDSTLTYDDEVITDISDAGLNSGIGLRYWSLYVQDRTNPNGYLEFSSVYLGDYWNPQRGVMQFPLQRTFVDNSVNTFSEGYQTYSDVYPQTTFYTGSWLGLQKADMEEFKNIYENYGQARPFWISLDTNEGMSTNYRRRIIFCKFNQDPVESLGSPDNFGLSISLREEL